MMNTIMYANILLAVIISACAAAGLTDEQLAKIFNEKPGRDNSLSETRRDYASIQDISDLDQALTTLLGDTDDTPKYDYSVYGATGPVNGATETFNGATRTLSGVTGTGNGATGSVNGATGSINGATRTVHDATWTVNDATGTVNGSTWTVNGATESVNGATGSVNGATGTVNGATGTVNGATGTVNGATGTVNGATGTVNGATKSYQTSGCTACSDGFFISQELESIFGDDMANNLKEANQRTLDILLDANDRGPADNSDLDFAFLQQDLVTSGAMSAVDDQSHNTDPNVPTDMTACLYTYKQNYALCSGLLNERNIQYDGDENYCTTRSCMEKLETLFKRSIKRDKPTECQTMGCKFTKYVKKSFCNRYGCGRRRKKTYSQHMIDRHGVVYPALTNVNVFGLPVSQRGYTSTKQTRSADTGAGVRQIPMCGSSTEGCIRKNTNRRRKRPKVKTVEMN